MQNEKIGGTAMTQVSIIRLLDEEMFFIDAGQDSDIQKKQFVEVLNPKHAYKNLAQVVDVFESYALCKKLGKDRIFFGDIVKPRPLDAEQ